MRSLRPKFITFDCYGTLIDFRTAEATRARFAGRVAPDRMDAFIRSFAACRLDETLCAWQPFRDLMRSAVTRACRRHGIPPVEGDADWNGDGDAIYSAVPTWGPHADVPEPLSRVAREFPLVILSNAADAQIHDNVAKLGAPFHAVFTAEQARAYKPRMRAFEYMLGELNANPEDVLHVSSSFRYDLMTAHDLGITDKLWVNRGHEPRGDALYGFHEVADIGGLPGLLGL